MRRLGAVVGPIVATVVALAIVVFFLGMRHYRVPSSAMEPTLHCSGPAPGCGAKHMDRILVPRFNPFWSPGRGDIVVFHTPRAAAQQCGTGGTFVKRIIGLPHEQLRERRGFFSARKRGEPWRKIDDSDWIARERRRADTSEGTYPGLGRYFGADEYFMVGDNRGASCDSRRWGPVTRDAIVGKAVLVYWPPRRIGVP